MVPDMRGSATNLDGDLLCQAPSVSQASTSSPLLAYAPILQDPAQALSFLKRLTRLPRCVPTSLPVVERAACRQIPITTSFRITGSMGESTHRAFQEAQGPPCP